MVGFCPILAIPLFLLIALVCVSFGRKVSLWLGIAVTDPLGRWVFDCAIGFGALAYLILAIGLCRVLYWWSVAVVIGVLATVSARETVTLYREAIHSLRQVPRLQISTGSLLMLIGAAVLACLVLIASLAPPSRTDWDGLAYHLAVPKMYVRHHAVFYVPFISHSNFPFLTEMLYTLGLSFRSVALAKLFHYAMYLIAAGGILSLCRRHINGLAGASGALIFMSVPLCVWEGGIAYADLTTAVYLLLAVYSVLNWEASGSRRWLIIAGLMSGFALGTKALAMIPAVTLCLWVFISDTRAAGARKGVFTACIVGAGAILVGSPWYIKTYLYTGNPVYPFLYNIFGGRFWSLEAAQSYRAAQLEFGLGRGLMQFVMLPWNITVKGAEFYDKGAVVLFGLVGPAFLGFLGILPLQKNVGKVVGKLLLVVGAFVVCWFYLMQSSRYLLPILPILSVAAGQSASCAITEWQIARRFASLFLVFCVAIAILVGLVIASDCFRVVVGLEPVDGYLERTLSIYPAVKSVNENTPYDARIVLYDEVRGFYLDREYIWGNPGHHEMIPYRRMQTGGDLIDWLLRHGYTHALVNWQIGGMGYAGHRRLLNEAIITGRMIEIERLRNVGIYEFVEE